MGLRILIVEDDDEIADYLLRGLREESFTVERAADGHAAWSVLRSGGWDIVLMDWWLPFADGLSLLKQFRQTDRVTPVLFLTARDAISDRVTGLDHGANDYICKPFAFEELLARVRVLTRKAGQADTSALSYQDLKIDLVSQRAERAGQRLDLPRRSRRSWCSSCVTRIRS